MHVFRFRIKQNPSKIPHTVVLFLPNKKAPHFCEASFVEPSGENANKFNEHLELILDFMGVLEHEPELWDKLHSL